MYHPITKNEAIRNLLTFPKDYTLGQVLYSVLQPLAVKNKTTVSFLLEQEDEYLSELVEKAKQAENE